MYIPIYIHIYPCTFIYIYVQNISMLGGQKSIFKTTLKHPQNSWENPKVIDINARMKHNAHKFTAYISI